MPEVTPALAVLGGAGWTVPPATPYVGGNQAAAYTWAGKPAANAVPVGTIIRVTDFGVPSLFLITDGVRWYPLFPQQLARGAAGIAVPADTNEDVLATITIPAGLLGLDGSLRVRSQWSYTNSANNKTIRVRLGGAAGTVISTVAATATTYAGFDSWISNRGAANSQIGGPSGQSAFVSSNAVAAPVTSAIDTSVDTTLVITGQKALAGETLTLDRYLVEVWP